MTEVTIPVKDPVVSNPKILGGTPVIKGTRIPASLIFDLLQRGYSVQLIQDEYPSLSPKKLSAFFALISESFNVSSTKAI